MPFAEPRPHRRPFCVHAYSLLVHAPKIGNLALTSLTMSNQDSEPHFADVLTKKGTSKRRLMRVLVPGAETVHLPFPHPVLMGNGRSLVVEDMQPGPALFTLTAVGYEWVAADDTS